MPEAIDAIVTYGTGIIFGVMLCVTGMRASAKLIEDDETGRKNRSRLVSMLFVKVTLIFEGWCVISDVIMSPFDLELLLNLTVVSVLGGLVVALGSLGHVARARRLKDRIRRLARRTPKEQLDRIGKRLHMEDMLHDILKEDEDRK